MIGSENVSVQTIYLSDYARYRDEMLILYMETFTTGDDAQYIDVGEAQTSLDSFMDSGFGIVALLDNNLVGFSIYTLLSDDLEFPPQYFSKIDTSKSLYIAEVLVGKEHRGKGIATMMLDAALKGARSSYSHAVIRVWENNRPALLLYHKLGFTYLATISQTKRSSIDRNFEMRKIYLAREF